jgi:hypothetical protein
LGLLPALYGEGTNELSGSRTKSLLNLHAHCMHESSPVALLTYHDDMNFEELGAIESDPNFAVCEVCEHGVVGTITSSYTITSSKVLRWPIGFCWTRFKCRNGSSNWWRLGCACMTVPEESLRPTRTYATAAIVEALSASKGTLNITQVA